MSIAFSGGTIQFSSFAATTTSALIGGIQTALTAAGWTVVSGGGTTNLQMQTALTPQNLQMRFRFHDNGLTVASQATVQISMQSVNGAIVGADNVDSPWVRVNASINFNIIAGPYYFWLVLPTSFTDYGNFAFGGVPWIPSFESGVVNLAYLCSQDFPNGSTGLTMVTFRNNNTCCGRNVRPAQQLLYNGTYISSDSNPIASDADAAMLKPWLPSYNGFGGNNVTSNSSLTTQFQDGSFCTADPWIGWSIQRASYPNNGDPTSVNGMLWDAVFIYDSTQPGDSTTTFFGHNWYAIGNQQTPTLWVASS